MAPTYPCPPAFSSLPQPSFSGSLPIRTPDFCPFDSASATLAPPAGPFTAHRLPRPGGQVGGCRRRRLTDSNCSWTRSAAADPSTRPSSAGLTLPKAALSDLCHCHQASQSWPVVHQTSDLAFGFSEKIEAFCLHPVSQRVDPPHTPFCSLEPSRGPSVSSLLLPPTPSWTLPGVLCFHNKRNSSPFLSPLNKEIWQSPIFLKIFPSDSNAFRHS